jgi:hypothetical protein
MNNRHRIVKITMKGFGLYLFYNIFTSIRKEYVVEQARVIREYLPLTQTAGAFRRRLLTLLGEAAHPRRS